MKGDGAERPLSCPACAARLAPVYAEATYGRVLLLDQCPACKGVWFDKWELYLLKAGSAASLSAIDVGPLPSPMPAGAREPGQCPRCSKGLVRFKDPAFPEGSGVFRCRDCSGLWLSRGGLEGYRRKKASSGASAPGEPRPAGKDTDKVEALKKLQKELDAGALVGRAGPALHAFDDAALDTGEFAKDVGFLILQALFRLLFKF